MKEVILRYDDDTFDAIDWLCNAIGEAGTVWECQAIFVEGNIHAKFTFQHVSHALLFKLRWA